MGGYLPWMGVPTLNREIPTLEGVPTLYGETYLGQVMLWTVYLLRLPFLVDRNCFKTSRHKFDVSFSGDSCVLHVFC